MEALKYYFDLWENKSNIFDTITIKYFEHGDQLRIQQFNKDVIYPSQQWYVHEVIIMLNNQKIMYSECYITIEYGNSSIIIE